MWDEIVRMANEIYQRRDGEDGFLIKPSEQYDEADVWGASKKYYEYLVGLAEERGLFIRGDTLKAVVLTNNLRELSEATMAVRVLLSKFGHDISKTMDDFMEE